MPCEHKNKFIHFERGNTYKYCGDCGEDFTYEWEELKNRLNIQLFHESSDDASTSTT